VVLFVISYTLMVMLVIEQNSTITNQRWLIRQLFADSSELTAMKGKANQKRQAEAQAQAQGHPKTESAPAPSTQVPSQQSARTNSSEKSMHRQLPPKPAADATDERRKLVAI
jgi:hypothetical protein